MKFLLTGGTAFFLSCIIVFLVRSWGRKTGFFVKPQQDRWHRKETASFGGIGIYLATILALIVYAVIWKTWQEIGWGLLAGCSIIFLLGLYDDIKKISPQAKLLGQFLAACSVILLGYTTYFFTPRIGNSLIAQIPNILLTFFWLIGITNAINLLDNMDGLAGGISFITACILSYLFAQSSDFSILPIAIALAGSVLGFLVFNFPPASIFMGDSGSMFLGFALAVLAIARQPQASNVFAIVGVPTVLFLLPIVDTVLVTITRLLRGQSPMQGGRDHTSHRLIAFGLSERQTVLGLYIIALISGIVAMILESLNYDLSLVLVPILILSLTLFTAYLGKIKVVAPETSIKQHGTILRYVLEFAYRRRILEVFLDLFLIGIAYYLAFWTRFGLAVNEAKFALYIDTLPVILIGGFLSFFLSGVYRGLWGYVGVDNLISYLKAAIGAVLLSGAVLFILYPQNRNLYEIMLLFGIFIFLGLTATRSSFKIFDLYSNRRANKEVERILIYGIGEKGELVANWLLMNPDLGLKPIGFIDDQPMDIGRRIHGIEILGSLDQLSELLDRKAINGVIITGIGIQKSKIDQILEVCRGFNCWVKLFSFELKTLE